MSVRLLELISDKEMDSGPYINNFLLVLHGEEKEFLENLVWRLVYPNILSFSSPSFPRTSSRS